MIEAQEPYVRADMILALGAAVRARRRELRLRQSELADLAGVSERLVHAIEHGKSTVQLDKLIDVLDAVGLHLRIHRGGAPWVITGPVDDITPGT